MVSNVSSDSVLNGVRKYVKFNGGSPISENYPWIVYSSSDRDLVFGKIVVTNNEFMDERDINERKLRQEFESQILIWYAENGGDQDDFVDLEIACDLINCNVISKDRAFLKVFKNMFQGGF